MAPRLNRKRGPRLTSACFPGSPCGPPSASPLASSLSAKRYHRSVPRLPCASAARPEASRVSAQTNAPRRSPQHLVQRASTATIEDPTLLALSKDPLQCIDQGTSKGPSRRPIARSCRALQRITPPVVGHARLSEFDFEGARDRSYVSALILPVASNPSNRSMLSTAKSTIHSIVSRHRNALIFLRKNILLII
jgi:hypothetical protein